MRALHAQEGGHPVSTVEVLVGGQAADPAELEVVALGDARRRPLVPRFDKKQCAAGFDVVRQEPFVSGPQRRALDAKVRELVQGETVVVGVGHVMHDQVRVAFEQRLGDRSCCGDVSLGLVRAHPTARQRQQQRLRQKRHSEGCCEMHR